MKGKTKQNPYRFSVSLDETDAEHRAAAAYLNSIGRKKSRVIVRALMAYLGREALTEEHDVRKHMRLRIGKKRGMDIRSIRGMRKKRRFSRTAAVPIRRRST